MFAPILAAMIVSLLLASLVSHWPAATPNLPEEITLADGPTPWTLRPKEQEIVAVTKELGGKATRQLVFAEGWHEWILDFSHTRVKQDNIRAILQMFRFPTVLTVLILRNSGVGDEIVSTLELRKPNIDASGKPTSYNRGLRVLDLAHTRLTSRGIRRIIAVHRGLYSLDLSALPVDSRCLVGIDEYPWLGTLMLQDTLLDDAAGSLLAATSLSELSLANSSIGNTFIKTLATPPKKEKNLNSKLLDSLRELDLSGTAVTDEALTYIKSFRDLKKLDLSRTSISDEAKLLQLAKSLPLLDQLNLSHTLLSSEAMKRISNACPELKIYK
jgi:Leucine-rich repeat (LRR) protein